MLIINQSILDRIFRDLETSKNIINVVDDRFVWALPHKHFWTVHNILINRFRYIHLILLQNFGCSTLSF